MVPGQVGHRRWLQRCTDSRCENVGETIKSGKTRSRLSRNKQKATSLHHRHCRGHNTLPPLLERKKKCCGRTQEGVREGWELAPASYQLRASEQAGNGLPRASLHAYTIEEEKRAIPFCLREADRARACMPDRVCGKCLRP